MAKLTANQGWDQFTHTLAKSVPLDLYRARRIRRGLLTLTQKVHK